MPDVGFMDGCRESGLFLSENLAEMALCKHTAKVCLRKAVIPLKYQKQANLFFFHYRQMRRHDQNSKPRVPHLPRLPPVLPPQPEVRVADPGPGALPADHDQLQSALRPGGPRLQVSAAAALRSAMAPPAGAAPRSSHPPRRSAALRVPPPPQCPGPVLTAATGLRAPFR